MQKASGFCFFMAGKKIPGLCGPSGARYNETDKGEGGGEMRLFVAIPLPDEAKIALRRSVGALEARWTAGRILAPEGYHVTLAFLGEQPEEGLAKIMAAMDRCRCPAFPAVVGEFGLFSQRGGHVLWRSVWSPELEKAQGQLSRELERAGFALESRPFLPHVTLARRVGLPSELLPEFLSAGVERFRIPVEGMALMRSQLSPQGASYQQLYQLHFDN